ncbi:unnamed protein product, partial [Rhizoctonia solani]
SAKRLQNIHSFVYAIFIANFKVRSLFGTIDVCEQIKIWMVSGVSR